MTAHPRGLLKTSFDAFMARPISTSGGRAKAFIAGFLLSPDFITTSPLTLANFYRHRDLVSAMERITKKIDDAVDTVPPSDVLAADFSMDEKGVSRFLSNRKYVPAAYMATIDRMVDAKLIPRDAATGYSNFFCETIKNRAGVQVELEKSCDPLLRQTMAFKNVNFAALFGTFFFGLSKPVADGHFTAAGGVNCATVREAYPNIYTVCMKGQYIDDLRDVLVDLQDEVEKDTITPNIFLARAMATEGGAAEMRAFHRKMASSPDPVSAAQCPPSLRESFDAVGDVFFDAVAKVDGAITRAILESFWQNSMRQGFMGPSHPEVVKGRKAHEARYESYR